MTRVEMKEAVASLSSYARKAHKEPVVITRDGKPIAALMPLDKDGWEDLLVSSHPSFRRLIRRSRARCKPGQGFSTEAMRRRLARRRKSTG
jgi:antitoxin (DNA-binding transcriptional repressor) of toxin-antitoxin stability system